MMGTEANRFILSTGMQHFSWREGSPSTYRMLFGESLFVQDGEEHRTKRKLLMPAFHREALQAYITTIEAITIHYLRKWERAKTFTWFTENKQYMFDVVSTLLIGCEPGEETERLSELFAELANGFSALPISLPGTKFYRAQRAREALLDHIEAAVRVRQQHPTEDALSLMVQSRGEDGSGLTMRELKEQSLLLLLAGHESTTSMITSFCYAMAQNPAVLAQARAEQDALRGPLTMERLRAMSYLDRVLKEVERMYAPVSGGFRGVVKAFEFNGYHIPEGWLILYNVHHTHYDESIFPDPKVFDPERFCPENDQSAQPFSLIGFGGGPRFCLGYPLALLAMKIYAVHLLRSYVWEPVPGQNLEYVYFPTLHPADGLKVNFSQRQD
jgi:cytochrome P450